MFKPETMRLQRVPDAVAYRVEHLRRWVFEAGRGSVCLFHVGHIAVDQGEFPHLPGLSQYVSLLVEFELITTFQIRADEGLYQYHARRSQRRAEYAPKAATLGYIDPMTYRHLKTIATREGVDSVEDAICRNLTCSRDASAKIIDNLHDQGFLTRERCPQITEAGWKALS